MNKINILLLLIFVSSCSTNQAVNYYDKTVDVKKCSNLICRKHKIHYNENKILLQNDKFEIKSTFKREHPLDPREYEANVYLQYTINF